jgi:hypothetical protein
MLALEDIAYDAKIGPYPTVNRLIWFTGLAILAIDPRDGYLMRRSRND